MPKPEDGAFCSARVFYVAYWGLLEPLGQSLVLPAVEGLAARGVRITLLTFEKGRDIADTARVVTLRERLAARGTAWTPLRYHKRPTLPATAFDVLQGLAVALWATRAGHRVDVVHGRTFIGGVIALLMARLTGKRWIYHNEGFWPDQQVEGGFWPASGWLYRWMKAIERGLYARADGLVVLSNWSKPVVEALPAVERRKPPIVVVPSCVDLAAFDQRTTSPRPRTLIYLGSPGGRYPIEPLGWFLAALLGRDPSARLVVLSQSSHDEIRAGLAAAGAPEEACEVTRVPHAEVPARLAGACAGLFFLRGGVGARSCSPTKVGEYWAAGLPVVCNGGIGDTDEIVRSRRVGLIVEEMTREQVAAAGHRLLDLLAEPDLADRCRRAAEDYYSLDEGVMRQIALYGRLA